MNKTIALLSAVAVIYVAGLGTEQWGAAIIAGFYCFLAGQWYVQKD